MAEAQADVRQLRMLEPQGVAVGVAVLAAAHAEQPGRPRLQ